MKAFDPVFRDADGWWFWDEIQLNRIGPHPTEGECRTELRRYMAFVVDGIEDDIPYTATTEYTLDNKTWQEHELPVQPDAKGVPPTSRQVGRTARAQLTAITGLPILRVRRTRVSARKTEV